MKTRRKTALQARQRLAIVLVNAKHEAGRLGLYKTMHAIDKATQAIGWELVESASKKEDAGT